MRNRSSLFCLLYLLILLSCSDQKSNIQEFDLGVTRKISLFKSFDSKLFFIEEVNRNGSYIRLKSFDLKNQTVAKIQHFQLDYDYQYSWLDLSFQKKDLILNGRKYKIGDPESDSSILIRVSQAGVIKYIKGYRDRIEKNLSDENYQIQNISFKNTNLLFISTGKDSLKELEVFRQFRDVDESSLVIHNSHLYGIGFIETFALKDAELFDYNLKTRVIKMKKLRSFSGEFKRIIISKNKPIIITRKNNMLIINDLSYNKRVIALGSNDESVIDNIYIDKNYVSLNVVNFGKDLVGFGSNSYSLVFTKNNGKTWNVKCEGMKLYPSIFFGKTFYAINSENKLVKIK